VIRRCHCGRDAEDARGEYCAEHTPEAHDASAAPKTEKLVFAIAVEENGVPDIVYLHAKDRGDAYAKLIIGWSSHAIAKRARIVGVAQAVGYETGQGIVTL
jgi:hypothetical protein